MMEQLVGSCIFAQSGGPTAVINASAYGVIKTALEAGNITRVFGAANGIKGVLEGKLYIMDEEDPDELKLLMNTPSSELGSCRYKMADPEENPAVFWKKEIVGNHRQGRDGLAERDPRVNGRQGKTLFPYLSQNRPQSVKCPL